MLRAASRVLRAGAAGATVVQAVEVEAAVVQVLRRLAKELISGCGGGAVGGECRSRGCAGGGIGEVGRGGEGIEDALRVGGRGGDVCAGGEELGEGPGGGGGGDFVEDVLGGGAI